MAPMYSDRVWQGFALATNPGLETSMRALGVCQALKGAWWMPRCREAMKGVDSCEKLRVAANRR